MHCLLRFFDDQEGRWRLLIKSEQYSKHSERAIGKLNRVESLFLLLTFSRAADCDSRN
jgi:hypothetical protein